MNKEYKLAKNVILPEFDIDSLQIQKEDNLFPASLPKVPSLKPFNFLKLNEVSRKFSEFNPLIGARTSIIRLSRKLMPYCKSSTIEDFLPGPIIKIKEFEPLAPYCQLFNYRTNVCENNLFTDLTKKISDELNQKKQESIQTKAKYPKWHKRKDQFNYPNNKF